MFYTEIHLSAGEYHQFCTLPKKGIEISPSFVYNVPIRVSAPKWKVSLPERSLFHYVHC